MVERLPEDVGVVLQPHALFAHRLVRGAAVVSDLCAELGAGGLEKVGFLFYRWQSVDISCFFFLCAFLSLFCWSGGFGVKGGIRVYAWGIDLWFPSLVFCFWDGLGMKLVFFLAWGPFSFLFFRSLFLIWIFVRVWV